VNATLILTLLRQRLRSPLRMILTFTFFSFPLLMAAGMPGAGLVPVDAVFVLILGAGMIGQDVSSGVLAGILARPVRRSEYVVSRWLGVALGASALVLVQVALGLAILELRGASPELAPLALKAAGSVLKVFGTSAVLLLLSCCVNGLGDLGLFLMGNLLAQGLKGAGAFKSWAWLERAGSELEGFLGAGLDPAQLSGAAFPAFALTSYLSTITLCVALAIVIVNRRELSYAAG
jgi:ABC-type Na+ efflux pump permease subunit